MDVLVVQHTPVEGMGRIAPLLAAAGLSVTLVAADAALPSDALAGASGLLVLGGPMGVYETEQHPRLLEEQRLIEAALRRRLPLLGICLGSQLLASVLGAEVKPGPQKELGWLDVELSAAAGADPLFAGAPSRFRPLHWHGDVFALPAGATPLARSALTEQQAFAVDGHAWGLLFHLEVDEPQLDAMCGAFAEEIGSVGQSRERLFAGLSEGDAALAPVADLVLGRWVQRVRAAR